MPTGQGAARRRRPYFRSADRVCKTIVLASRVESGPYRRDVLEAVDPLAPLGALAADVEDAEVVALDVELRLDDPRRLDARTQKVLSHHIGTVSAAYRLRIGSTLALYRPHIGSTSALPRRCVDRCIGLHIGYASALGIYLPLSPALCLACSVGT